jgi:predicted membrane-bound spermidine synthase
LSVAYRRALAIFFASGFAALVYQIVWQRVLTLFVGAEARSVALVVSAFMAGLGLGSLAGGHWADRWGARRCVLAFSLSQAAIALFAFGSIPLYYDLLYARIGPRDVSPALSAALLFATLLWPTFWMGAGLPLLARALLADTGQAAARIGALYGVNSLGGAVGCLATAWLLAPRLGFRATVAVAGLVSLACAGASLFGLPRGAAEPARALRPETPAGEGPENGPRLLSLRAWLLVYVLSGFMGLSLEIVWFRLLHVMLRGDASTFAMLLAVYLGGLGLGALACAAWVRGSRHPGPLFLAGYGAVAVFAGSSAALLAEAARRRTQAALALMAAGPGTEGVGAGPASSPIQVALPLLLMLPPTLLMGASLPLLQKAVQTDLARVGRRLGALLAANILGSLGGVALTGLVALPILGTSTTLRILTGLGAVFLLLWARAEARGPLPYLATLAAIVAAALVPSGSRLWASLHRAAPADVHYAEDGSGVCLIKEARSAPTFLYMDGRQHSGLPYGGANTVMGALPSLIHPAPETIASIGLAAGDSLFSSGGRAETRRIECIEIFRPQLELLRGLAGRRPDYAGLGQLLADPRVRYRWADGRAFLEREPLRYDIIQAYAQLPDEAHAGNLYSYEYFRLVGRRLRPGGYAVSWDSTPRMRDTFVKAFPHALALGPLLIGSAEPIPFDPQRVRARLQEPFTKSYFERADVDIEGLLERALEADPVDYGPGQDRSRLLDVNTDLHPKDELRLAR